MERHVRLLAVLIAIWGALAVLAGVSLLLLAVGPVAILNTPHGENVGLAASFMTGVFAIIGAFAGVWGGVHVWTAARLRRHEPLGRIVALALALVNLLVLPFGTALGIYALWILLTDEGRRLFEYNQEQPTGTQA